MKRNTVVVGLLARIRNVTFVAAMAVLSGSVSWAGVMSIDLSGYTGQNGGIAAGSSTTLFNFPAGAGSRLTIFNQSFNATFGTLNGITMMNSTGGGIAVGGGFCTPINFGAGATIDANAGGGSYRDEPFPALFGTVFGNKSPAFGVNSYLGFKDSLGRFGYIEVTWDGVDKFQLISAAYESDPGVAIQTPGGGGAVPEPTSMAIFGLGALGMAYRARRKSKV